MCCTWLTKNTRCKNYTKNRHLCAIAPLYRAISSQLRHVSTIWKKLVKQQYLRQMSHNMVNFGPLMAEIGSGVWGTPANFNGFQVLASLLQWCHSLEDNQTLHDVWPSPQLVHYLYIFRALARDGILPDAKFTLHPSLAFCYIGSVTARHSSSWRHPKFAAWYKERNYRTFADGATYIRLSSHHVGHRPTF